MLDDIVYRPAIGLTAAQIFAVLGLAMMVELRTLAQSSRINGNDAKPLLWWVSIVFCVGIIGNLIAAGFGPLAGGVAVVAWILTCAFIAIAIMFVAIAAFYVIEVQKLHRQEVDEYRAMVKESIQRRRDRGKFRWLRLHR